MLSSKPKTTNVQTVAGQVNAPVTTVSQPSSFEVQRKVGEVEVQSIPKDEMPWYDFNEDDILRDVSIVARPLMTDESYKIKAKDSHYAFRWVEYKAHDGFYYNKACAFGFINCTPEDLIAHRGTVRDNKIYNGDTILMKMPKSKYGGMIKANLQRSNAMISNKGAIRQAIAHAGPVVTTGRQPTFVRDKVEFFEPTRQDMNEVMPEAPVRTGEGLPDKVFESL